MADSKYVLNLRGLGLNNSEVETLTYSSTKFSLSLYGVSFTRRMYEPGHIQAEVLLTTEQITQQLQISTITEILLNEKVSLSYEGTVVAQDYYVHNITPLVEVDYEKKDGKDYYKYAVYVKLDIFSPDKKMTLNKYSQAHLGRCLVKDIVGNSLVLFGDMELKTGLLQHLSYSETSGGESTSHELVQPYLVQYNETFYDFITRVANRCGEPFYYEDGKFWFGIQELPKPEDSSETPSPTAIDGAKRIMFQQFSSGPITVKDYARDAVKEERKSGSTYTYDLKDDQILTDPVKLSDANPSYSVGEFPYNSEISPEDQYMILYKNKFARDDLNSLWVGDKVGKALDVVAMILESTSLLELITEFSTTSIHSAIQAHVQSEETNNDGNEAINDKDYKVLFMDTDKTKSHWVTLKYHQDIRNKEAEQMRKGICVDMGEEFRNVQLGEQITIPNSSETYVVTRIEMSSATSWQREYGEYIDTKTPEAAQSQRIYAIPMDKVTENNVATYVFYPPLLPISPFRQSGPQPAFITDSGDWKGQGRVRVRFPWQPKYSNTSAKNAFDAAEKELKKIATINDDGTFTKSDKVSDKDFNDAVSKYKQCKAALEAADELVEDDATPWIRMSSPMATSGGGMYFKPEEGDEVMVDFENGNVEHPYVVGTLYSKNVTVPDGSRIIQSKNGHTIKMSDPKDGTQLLAGMYPGLKLLKNYGVKMDFMDNVCNEVLGGIEMTDKYGFYKIKMSSHDRCVSIASPFGDVKMSAFSGIKINAPNGDIKIVGKNVDITAYNKFSITSGKNIKLGLDNYHLGYLGAFTKGDQVGEAVGSLISSFYADFFDLSFIRSILEVFIRPVDGTLSIKSNRYLMLGAGNGKPAPAGSNYRQFDDSQEMGMEAKNLVFAVPFIDETLQKYVATYIKLFNTVYEKLDSFLVAHVNYPATIKTPASTKDLLIALFQLDPANLSITKFGTAFEGFIGNTSKWDHQAGTAINTITEHNNKLKPLMRAVMELKKHHLQYLTILDDLRQKGAGPSGGRRFTNFFRYGTVRYHHKGIPFTYDAILKLDKAEMPNPTNAATHVKGNKTDANPAVALPTPNPTTPTGNEQGFYHDWYTKVDKYVTNSNPDGNLFTAAKIGDNSQKRWLVFVARRIICAMIEYCRTNENVFKTFKVLTDYPAGSELFNPSLPISDSDWATYVKGVKFETKPQDDPNWGQEFLSGLLEGAVFDPLSKLALFEIGPWKADTNGELLFSDRKGATFRFTENGSTEKFLSTGRIEGDASLTQEAMKNIKVV